ncbi:MAG TPA: polyphosphate kinase 1 [Pyrinomonadaceae bacterium]|nr:polyphosphate kinase 1 [Pyrinomonadaceae bacterium]
MTTTVNRDKHKNSAPEPQPAKVSRNPRHQKQLFINRELSWLEFNRRVLEEALDERHPLLERLKFLAIFSSNLDEFFMVRVSGLQEAIEAEIFEESPDGMSPLDQLAEIRSRLKPMLERQMRCLSDDVLPKLAEEGIVIRPFRDLTKRERKFANDYFLENVFPILTPQAVDPSHPFPYISNLSLNLGVMVSPAPTKKSRDASSSMKEARFARIKLPPIVPRLVPIDEKRSRFTFLGSLISANMDALFPNMRTGKAYLFRVTRDADFEIKEDEAGDLLRTMQKHVRRMRFGDAVRLEVSASMPREMVSFLTKSLELRAEDVYSIDGPLNIPDLMQLYDLGRPELKDRPLQVSVPAAFRESENIFAAINDHDVLLHHPYTSYGTVTNFISAAASDPNVAAIKICLYRTGPNSPIVKALIDATEKGKQVTALVELKARFDEESNIEWARRLEQAGVHVVYGMVGLKTHCKLTLIVRREGKVLQRYVHLATGNYNPTTSRIYTDLGLFTCDNEIADDATNLFNSLTGYSQFSDYDCLLVAPLNLRKRIIKLIRRETAHAKAGRAARIIAKLNSLTDIALIRALYAASQAGVSIDLIVRGICMLRPGVPQVSENIRVRSIVGRFLEHSRILYFANNSKEEVFIGSADLMYRNLSRRVEVLTPIKDATLRTVLKDIVLAYYLKDNVNARELRPDGTYVRVKPMEGDKRFDAQIEFETVEFSPVKRAEVKVLQSVKSRSKKLDEVAAASA